MILRSVAVVFQQNPDGTLERRGTYELKGQASDLAVADLNTDGLPDLLTDTSGAVALFNDPADPGSFLAAVPIDM